MSNYQKQKEKARQKAIEYQLNEEKQTVFWSEICFFSNYFYKLAKRYGLIKEFRENCII
jgi:hypothetical protein